MTKTNRSWLCFGTSMAALAACTVMVGMSSNPGLSSVPDRLVVKGYRANELAAAETLKAELNRRFTDRQNIDFGMSRIVRPDTRLHYGPTMAKTRSVSPEKTRPTGNGQYEFESDGKWYPMNERKPLMLAENDAERQAIGALKNAGVDVAIYAIGQFQLDKGEEAVGDPRQVENQNLNYRGFSYGNNLSLRVKGPAYTSQNSQMAPRAWEMVKFGRKAWASKKKEYSAKGQDGWDYMAHRVDAPDMSCAKCHGVQQGSSRAGLGTVQKPGDATGLFVIALRRR